MPTRSTRPTPPPALSPRAAQLWRDLTAEYEFAPADMELLRQCCQALQRADEAAVILDAEGLSVADRYGSPKAHPLLEVEARARSLFARLLAQLRVVGVPVGAGRRGRPGFTQNPKGADPRLRQPAPTLPVAPLGRQRIRLDGGAR